jgi:hypothetical protein
MNPADRATPQAPRQFEVGEIVVVRRIEALARIVRGPLIDHPESRRWVIVLVNPARTGQGRELIIDEHALRHEQTCRGCGCTDSRACALGCRWVAPDLCSSCAT